MNTDKTLEEMKQKERIFRNGWKAALIMASKFCRDKSGRYEEQGAWYVACDFLANQLEQMAKEER